MAANKGYDTAWSGTKATADAVRRFEEQFAKNLGFAPIRGQQNQPIRVIPTGSIDLDAALKIGGYPLGRITQLWGVEHSGKTSLAHLAVASAQRTYPDKMCAWVDPEATYDEGWATMLGVDHSRLWRVDDPKTAERAADSYRKFVESGACSLVVLDSIGALTSAKEFEKQAEEDTVALVARVVTRLVGQVSAIAHANGTALLLVNQTRSSIGSYGSPLVTTGGHRVQFATSIKIKVGRGGEKPKTVKFPNEDEPVPVCYEMALKVEKNKLAPHGSVAHPWLTNRASTTYGPVGIDQAEEAVTFGLRTGAIVQGGGGNYTLPGGDKVRGRDRAVEFMRGRPEEIVKIRDQVIASLVDEVGEQPERAEEIEDPDPHGLSEVVV